MAPKERKKPLPVVEPGEKETLVLETAATLYDVKLSTLRLMCIKGKVESKKVGKRRYVTKAAMDTVFKIASK